MKDLMILTANSNYIIFIILNVIFIGIGIITIMMFINEKEKRIEKRLNEIEEKVERKQRRPRGKIEKESNN